MQAVIKFRDRHSCHEAKKTVSKYRKNGPCSQGQSENCFTESVKVNITSDDLVSVGQLQTETMLMRTQLDYAQTTIQEMENVWYNEHVYIMNCNTHCKIY